MPAARTNKKDKHSITAWNEEVAKYERITTTKEVRDKYKGMFKPNKVPKPKSNKVNIRPLTLQERMEIQEEAVEETATRTLLSRLMDEKKKLEDRITTPPPPLIERIEPQAYEPEIKPLDPKLHFDKNHIVTRRQEFGPIFEATKSRFNILAGILQEEDEAEKLGLHTSVPKEVRDTLWRLQQRFEDAYEMFHDKPRWNDRKWRDLRGAMRRFGHVKFHAPKTRRVEICNKLVELNITINC